MTLDVPSEYEAVIQQAVANGAFGSPEEALRHALKLLAIEQSESQRAKPKSAPEHEQWGKQFRAWADGHQPVGHFVDDSRESIY
ncbi:hypothetical protein DTL42_07100 [Bremerella cremea]|uniref:Type II toxin-antitoxin system ParD family antitoxin n=1 Tax=Bremerella cremea TaxID=1031537 RepID=A0A368KWZ9_9BACT|nr:hypothetical protein [Bremerella cremea]RCS54871.1 hypothetical protein DTL42_07100 [Bremerella cremea]